MRKIITLLLALAAAFTLTTAAFADSAGFAVEKERALPVRTPYDKSRVDILWHTNDGKTVGAPIASGEYVLLPTLNTVRRYSEKDGELIATAELDDKVSEDVRGAVLDGVLVQPARDTLYAIDTESMSVICSKEFGEIVTDVALVDELAYFGVKTGSGYSFFCADSKNGFEIKWEYRSDFSVTSPALFGEFILFGAGENLVAYSTDGSGFKENPVSAEITNVFAGKYAVFMTGADGNLYKLRLTDDGTAEEDTLTSCKLGGELTAPAEYNNRVYVGSTEGFFVLDGLNMDILKAYPELKNSSAPIITYGTGQRAYTVAPNAQLDRDVLYSILDTEDGQTLSEIVKLIDYSGGKFAVSSSGTMYFRNADGKLWAIAVSQNNIFIMILKVVLTLAILAMMIIIIIAWSKKRKAKRPPEY